MKLLISTKYKKLYKLKLRTSKQNYNNVWQQWSQKSNNNENDKSTIKLIGVIVAGDKQNNNWIVPVFFPVIYDLWFFIYFTI